ncbi:unnamed protein product, partial [Schistocephalus solidus]|uniref:HTH CENPB-type domain-containing protein n=1 Tax=Schistocephalus solidus TaxID=70667 RepID=A0A183TQG3_SCHSO
EEEEEEEEEKEEKEEKEVNLWLQRGLTQWRRPIYNNSEGAITLRELIFAYDAIRGTRHAGYGWENILEATNVPKMPTDEQQ